MLLYHELYKQSAQDELKFMGQAGLFSIYMYSIFWGLDHYFKYIQSPKQTMLISLIQFEKLYF